ncbi:hypothetical protein [Micromonospora sp. 4G55]|uniref:hypothetical protein n=1 Tax=Micromonospora sp. 4G55 TaxID=2806102 RepID=UPI001A36C6C2|nr:hypothetical protein [Micromonospora sp. 4G55]MBM0258473.1 hypothetical protein [Micromonospora sp. 4G55]
MQLAQVRPSHLQMWVKDRATVLTPSSLRVAYHVLVGMFDVATRPDHRLALGWRSPGDGPSCARSVPVILSWRCGPGQSTGLLGFVHFRWK